MLIGAPSFIAASWHASTLNFEMHAHHYRIKVYRVELCFVNCSLLNDNEVHRPQQPNEIIPNPRWPTLTSPPLAAF